MVYQYVRDLFSCITKTREGPVQFAPFPTGQIGHFTRHEWMQLRPDTLYQKPIFLAKL